MEVRIEHLDLNNNPAASAEAQGHKEIIKRNTVEGFRYCGFVPAKMGPSGKMLSIDLVFQK